MSTVAPQERLIFICSLGHSGSTLLDLTLGAHPSMAGLGEALNLLRSPAEEILAGDSGCSCGETAAGCPLWGRVLAQYRRNPGLSLQERYALLLRQLAELYGEGCIPIDSSKHLWNLEFFAAMSCEVKVLRLYRDVRSFALSYRNKEWRKKGKRRTLLGAFLHWYRKNQALDRKVAALGLPSHALGYEELCFQTEQVLDELCRFAGVAFAPEMLDPGRSHSHVLLGNRMRTELRQRSRVVYDHRWLIEQPAHWPSLFLPRVMAYNARKVYGNLNVAEHRP